MPTAQYVLIALVGAACLIALARFELFCFHDLAGRADRDLYHLTKAGWAVVIALVIPVGGVMYLFFGRAP